MRADQIRALCADLIETSDHVGTWSEEQKESFALGYARGVRAIRSRDRDVEALLITLHAGGTDAARRIADGEHHVAFTERFMDRSNTERATP